ncbi:MlaD family protein [Mycobacterium sp. CVI_P3]|uniref:MlaD family protein n=1 Tax=Mycobacterium pinniadriaticum TaxID=2994102 RepID=A0ABT3SGY4_9MYCO|nr:MlaD family protein [Mycobacterium pinniadriaticum]MCX2931788.1 MlaD family protein [Mycobacterium pinniadriaticum]MCX2938137.1 MlaD family protein [Mycobacterium pinniadriaticum]
MRQSKWVKIQLAIFVTVAVVAGAVMIFGYIRVPALFGVGHYTVTMQLAQAGGLYERANVTYRGTEVGRVTSIRLTPAGVDAVLSLRSDVPIPSDLDAQVHSTSAIGEQYVALVPRSNTAPSLKDSDVIPMGRTSVPPDINALLDATNRGLRAIPRDSLKTAIDESYTAVGGLGPEISRIVRGSTQLAIDARANLDPLVQLIDRSQPLLDSQTDTADSIHSWAAHLANLTRQLKSNDSALGSLLEGGGQAASEARQLIDRLQPTLPVLLANLVSVGQLALTYQPAIEQLLVLLPMGVGIMANGAVANRDTKGLGGYVLAFNLNLNLPPACTTGYLPAQQQRIPTLQDSPEPPHGDLYCRIPQDSWLAVRGARNTPCLTNPGKRAPMAKMCKSDEQYVPLNDGSNWKGDPNGTLTGQDVVEQPPNSLPASAAPPLPPIAVTYYDPATGSYVGPDGRTYTHSDLAQNGGQRTWQSMLTPPTGN